MKISLFLYSSIYLNISHFKKYVYNWNIIASLSLLLPLQPFHTAIHPISSVSQKSHDDSHSLLYYIFLYIMHIVI